ncbi:MAG: transcriptional regulator [Acidobacteria bacterium]|nr:transcriptional regulator [Acidobacteriota bacterium]
MAYLNRKQPTAFADNSRSRLRAVALEDLGVKNFFRASDAAELGVNSRGLRWLVDDGLVERVARGLYRLASAEPTEHYSLAAVCTRVPGAIVCLLSALNVHGLGTQLPRDVWIAIPHKARTPLLPELPVRVIRFSGASLRYGVGDAAFEGIPARITSPARTVVDCFRFRRLVGKDVALGALRDALRERKANADEIWRAAEVCRAKSLVGPVLEMLCG